MIITLPNYWSCVKLGDVCDIVMGQSPPSSTYNTEEIGLPFFQGKAEFTELYPEVRKWCSEPKKTAEQYDILVSVRAPVGSTNIANQKCCIGRGLAAIRYPDCNKFIFYFFRLNEKELDKLGTGTTFKAISNKTLRELKIPLPPLPEQKKIVEKIEELFSGLDSGVASLKKAKEQLWLYRQSVLASAFNGRLDGGSQKSNVKSQKEMLKAAEPEVKYKNNGLPESWKWVKLGEVCGIEMGQSPPSSTYNTDKIGLPFFQGKAEFTEFHPEVRKWCSKPKKIAEPFDILLSVRAPVGSTNIANQKCCIGRGLAAIRYPNCYKYIFYHLRFIENKLDELGTGSTFKAISSITLRNVKIPLPPLSEQSQIVEEIESRFAGSEALEKAIDDSLTKAETLRQSILKRAFEGTLI